jgi:D-alanine-D-alanine ligase
MTIAILYGGRSGEHEISLISAAAIARNIDKKYTIILIGITKDGRWFLQDEHELERIRSNEKTSLRIQENAANVVFITPGTGMDAFCTSGKKLRIDVVFPALHGTYGEDGTVQGLLEMVDIPYVGCNVMASAITMDKEKTKAIWHNAGLPVVPYVCIKRTDLLDSRKYDEIVQKAIETLHFPLFVKPCSAGSSDGTSKATTSKELSVALLDAFQWDNKVLIEKAINAREIECSVTGNATTAPAENDVEQVKVYGPGEIVPTHMFYDYDAKYNDPDGAALKIPADLPEKMLETVRTIAAAAYKTVDASGLSRVDFFIDKDNDILYLNEINTIPGFTQISMFPKLCGHAGLNFTELTTLLINEAIARYKAKSALQTSR